MVHGRADHRRSVREGDAPYPLRYVRGQHPVVDQGAPRLRFLLSEDVPHPQARGVTHAVPRLPYQAVSISPTYPA